MRFSPFLLDDWLNHYQHSEPPIEYAGVRQLLEDAYQGTRPA